MGTTTPPAEYPAEVGSTYRLEWETTTFSGGPDVVVTDPTLWVLRDADNVVTTPPARLAGTLILADVPVPLPGLYYVSTTVLDPDGNRITKTIKVRGYAVASRPDPEVGDLDLAVDRGVLIVTGQECVDVYGFTVTEPVLRAAHRAVETLTGWELTADGVRRLLGSVEAPTLFGREVLRIMQHMVAEQARAVTTVAEAMGSLPDGLPSGRALIAHGFRSWSDNGVSATLADASASGTVDGGPLYSAAVLAAYSRLEAYRSRVGAGLELVAGDYGGLASAPHPRSLTYYGELFPDDVLRGL